MKKTRIVLVGALVLALAFVMGCKMGAGDGDLKGTKWDSTLTIDGTDDAQEPLVKDYRRYWKQLGTKETVTKVQTTISIDREQSIVSNADNSKRATIGFVFDMHKYEAKTDGGEEGYTYKVGDELVEFVLLGIRPSDGAAFLEHYYDIPAKGIKTEDGKQNFDTDLKSLVPLSSTDSYVNGAWGEGSNLYGFGADVTKPFIVESKKGDKVTAQELTIKVEGTSAKYFISLKKADGTFQKIAEYTPAGYDKAVSTTNQGVPQGGVGVYANVPKGCKLVASYVQDKDNTVGLYVEEE